LFWSDPRIDVESFYKRVLYLSQNPDIIADRRTYLELAANVNKIKKYLDHYAKKYYDIITPEKQAILVMIRRDLESLLSARDNQKMRSLRASINECFMNFNLEGPAYLVRHPEKADSNNVGFQSSSGRELTYTGVRQAKEFSEKIIDEILCTGSPVKVFINHSPYLRTEKFARIVQKKISWAASRYGKKVDIFMNSDNRLSGDLPKTDGKALDDWMVSLNAHETSKQASNWFLSKPAGTKESYVISIGITHLPNICAFLHDYLRVSPKKAMDFRYANFIKLEKGRFNYEGRWY